MREIYKTYSTILGDIAILTTDVYDNILSKHPEVLPYTERIERVLLQPDEVRQSSTDSRVTLYYRFETDILLGKWLVVVVKQVEQAYISTVYLTDRIKSGDVIWPK